MGDEESLKQAVDLIKNGEKYKGGKLLEQLVRQEPENEMAWLWLSACVSKPEQKIYCLEKVIRINPDNQKAREALDKLKLQTNQPTVSEILGGEVQGRPLSGTQKPAGQKPGINRNFIIFLVGISLVFFLGVLAILVIAFVKSNNSTNLANTGVIPNKIAQASPTAITNQLNCQSETKRFITEEYFPLLQQFDNARSRKASIPFRQGLEYVTIPDCARGAVQLIKTGLDRTLADTNSQIFLQGVLDYQNGNNQLLALASGAPTPIPRLLPTDTPIPTLSPTATALPPNSIFMVDNWQIQVDKIEIAQSLTGIGGGTEKAAGRFALIFMRITNRGLSPDTFIAFGVVGVKDASGRYFEENFLVSGYAEEQYNTEIGAQINPDTSEYVVAAYDISKESDYYILVPSRLVKQDSNMSMYLNIPPR